MNLLRASFLLLITGLTHAGDDVVGRIGSIELHASDLQEQAGRLDEAGLSKVVQAMLVQRVVLDEALEKKWHEQPAVQALLKNTRDAAIADSYLKGLCEPPKDYPGEKELQTAYEAAKATFTVPRSFRLAQIFVSADRLEAVKARLKAAPDQFGQIAREMSEDTPSAARDGEIGWLTEKQIQPEILAQLPKLALNVIAEPLRLKDGWHILKVLDVREAHTPFFGQVRTQLVQQLRAERTKAAMQAYMTELLHKHPVGLNGEALSKLARPKP